MALHKKIWSHKEIEILKYWYPISPTSEVAKILDRRVTQVYNKANILGLKKTQEYLQSPNSGRLTVKDTRGGQSRFKKGHTPWNVGLKGFMGRNKTSFKKGNKPHNYRPVGSKRIDKDGYIQIKIADPSKWNHLHVYNWEQKYGPVPKGYMVKFKDGDRTNTDVENLYICSRSKNMLLNTIHRFPPEVVGAIKTLSNLKKKIHAKEQN